MAAEVAGAPPRLADGAVAVVAEPSQSRDWRRAEKETVATGSAGSADLRHETTVNSLDGPRARRLRSPVDCSRPYQPERSRIGCWS